VLATETGVASTPIGFVVIPINPPPVFVAIRELGPTLTWVGLILLAIGAASAALLIFSPAHRRLRTLEQAARALGEGRTDVRAVEGGGDEVSTLAHAFNRMADDLGARAEALAASDRARRQLLADVSHELMTPLAAVRGYTETLAMPELSLDPSTRGRYLGIIGDETQKLESLIGDLLDLARLEGGGGALAFEEVPVKELFSRIADRHGPAIRDRRITLDVCVTPPDLTVLGDGQRLEQALQNLAANALRHTPEGGRLSLAAEDVADGTRITVRDTGPGIPPEHLPHVFERFYKADAARSATRMSGSGLGLSIVQAIVERHAGTVTATNAPDGGAVFEIRIPRPDRPPSD
jgi:two-component system sensor histidine kinase MtrB